MVAIVNRARWPIAVTGEMKIARRRPLMMPTFVQRKMFVAVS
jgi:hypothetical protein